MNIGDTVKFLDLEGITGLLLSYGDFSEGWWDILNSEGKIVVWPESQLEVLNESR